MPENEPSFSSTPLPDAAAEVNHDVGRKNKIVRKKRAPVKKEAESVKKKNVESEKEKEINKQLASIYQDDNGDLPDMKEIKLRQGSPFLRALFTLIIIGGLLAASTWVGFFVLSGGNKFTEEQVSLDISGPANIVAGATTTYVIRYKNDQNIALKNVTLNIQYPDGFIFNSSEPASSNAGHTEWDMGSLPPYQQGEVTITGLTSGSILQQQSWRALLSYEPENFSSKLQKTSIYNVAVGKSPFSLSITGPDKVMIGNSAEYVFSVKKEDATQLGKIEVKPTLPANLFITSSSPLLNKDGSWILDLSKSGATTSMWNFKLSGKYSSSSEPSVSVSGDLLANTNNLKYQLAESTMSTGLLQNNLDFSLAINGGMSNFNAQPGNTLNMTVYLKNLNNAAIHNASLKLTLDAPSVNKQSILNWAQISDEKDGDIKGTQISDTIRRGELSWNKNKIPELAQISENGEASIDINLPIKDISNFPINELKTYQISAIAEVSFTDAGGVGHTFSSNPVIITLNSDLKFESRDAVSANEKTHDLQWIITNNFHPLKNVILSADVYGDVTWQTDSTTPAGQVNYDEKDKKITWAISEMPEGVDVLALPFSLTLNTVNPTQNMLVSKVHITADDTVTGESLDFLGDEVMLK